MSRQRTILFINHNPLMFQSTINILHKNGFIVYTAETWSRVPNFVSRVQPDLILIDDHMAAMESVDPGLMFRENSRNPRTRIKILSDEDNQPTPQTSQRCGADGCISKTLLNGALAAKIETTLISRPSYQPVDQRNLNEAF